MFNTTERTTEQGIGPLGLSFLAISLGMQWYHMVADGGQDRFEISISTLWYKEWTKCKGYSMLWSQEAGSVV